MAELPEIDSDADDWYILQYAQEHGIDPQVLWRRLRSPPAVLPVSIADEVPSPTTGITWPPGFAGRLARYLCARSYNPIPEVAITATIALLAGVCGRAYRTYTDTDVALYIILVARSGIGKDAIHTVMPKMLDLAEQPLASSFVRAVDFVSGPALHKEMLRMPGFLNLQGEFGKKLKRMASNTDAPMQAFRTVLLNAYNKSYLDGISYSNPEDGLEGVHWPALSFLGETTPGTFLECITPDMMADGLMSRFLVVSYMGDRPPPNRARNAVLASDDLALWKDLVGHAIKYQMPFHGAEYIRAEPNADAQEKLERFEEDARASLNATEDESERQVWNRAHLKVLKIASLLAIADNYLFPVVRIEHVAWAASLVRQDVAVFQNRKRSGDIGIDDDARQRKLTAFMLEYIANPPKPSYKVPDGMRENTIIPRSYLQIRTATLSAFTNHSSRSSTKALDETLRSFLANGYLKEVKSDKLIEMYSFHGVAYRILKLPS